MTACSFSGDYQHVTTSLERRLEELEQPKAHLAELTGQTLPIRLYASARLHRLLPDAVALRLAALRGRLEWFVVPSRRAEARKLTAAIRGSRSAKFAQRRLVEDAVRAEVQWRPWMFRRLSIEGYERFEAALAASGAGVILANLHVGPFLGLVHALAARGFKLYLPGGTWGVPTMEGLRGRWMATQNRWAEEAGCRWVPIGGSYPALRALLERGEICLMAVDVPGELEVDLAGRPCARPERHRAARAGNRFSDPPHCHATTRREIRRNHRRADRARGIRQPGNAHPAPRRRPVAGVRTAPGAGSRTRNRCLGRRDRPRHPPAGWALIPRSANEACAAASRASGTRYGEQLT